MKRKSQESQIKESQKLKSLEFQKDSWKIFGLLPTNEKLQKELATNENIAKIIQISKKSKWATSFYRN